MSVWHIFPFKIWERIYVDISLSHIYFFSSFVYFMGNTIIFNVFIKEQMVSYLCLKFIYIEHDLTTEF